jgi:hypothetical protein
VVDFDRTSRDDKKMHEAILGCVRHLHVAVEKSFQVDGRGLRKGSFSISVESMGGNRILMMHANHRQPRFVLKYCLWKCVHLLRSLLASLAAVAGT